MFESLDKLNNQKYSFNTKTKIAILLTLFVCGSIVGYIYEFIYCLLIDHEIVNRGFLYGPYLPVYGFGTIFIYWLLKRFKKNPLIVYLLAMLVTGIIEYITGYLMFKIFNRTWWDYTGLLLNIDGYVCLRSVVTFGIGGLLLIYVIEPLINMISIKLNSNKYLLYSCLVILVILIDLSLTLTFRNTL